MQTVAGCELRVAGENLKTCGGLRGEKTKDEGTRDEGRRRKRLLRFEMMW